ncbi:MAG: STM4012 family radical SAM protein [Planctomycetes bacterium]|nr:STM4012 family radical SAM protein [Planctomycetota bacterium]
MGRTLRGVGVVSLATLLLGSAYQGYSYAYPHKTAYRPLATPRTLADVWADEPRGALFLYVHVPFCAVRCGFCNLFATTTRDASEVEGYLAAIEHQAKTVSHDLSGARYARLAIGGGTPSYLTAAQIDRLFGVLAQQLGVDPCALPTSFELAPVNTDAARLAALRAHGVDRVSIGVQTFDDDESRALGRPRRRGEVAAAIALLREHGFATLNLDLIYGGAGQSLESWLASLESALRFEPEELYLYPLYVRRLTGLSHRDHRPDDGRLALYRAGRDLLLERGYRQLSMRMFRASHAPATVGPEYCCQRDGMVGLGPGARSYTTDLHYSGEYAVGRTGVRAILDRYLRTEDHSLVDYGFALDPEERRRRFVIQGLLQAEGLDLAAYRTRFGNDAERDLSELHELVAHGLATAGADRITLTAAGLERSDVVGPWLASQRVRQLMEGYAWR